MSLLITALVRLYSTSVSCAPESSRDLCSICGARPAATCRPCSRTAPLAVDPAFDRELGGSLRSCAGWMYPKGTVCDLGVFLCHCVDARQYGCRDQQLCPIRTQPWRRTQSSSVCFERYRSLEAGAHLRGSCFARRTSELG